MTPPLPEILLVYQPVPEAPALETAFAGRGRCRTAGNTHQALECFVRALEAGQPYKYIVLDLDLPGLDADELMAKIREWDEEPFAEGVVQASQVILLASAAEDILCVEAFRQGKATAVLKPLEPEKAGRAMDGCHGDGLSPGQRIDFSGAARKLLKAGRPASESLLRRKLEKMLRQVTYDGLAEVQALLASPELNLFAKLALVRACGQAVNPYLAGALRQLLDPSVNPMLAKEAIAALARYPQRRAALFLQDGCNKIQDASLRETIQHHLAQLPAEDSFQSMVRRLLEDNSKPVFRGIVDTLLRLCPATEADLFLDLLEHPQPLVAAAAFEILCHRGGEHVFQPIWIACRQKLAAVTDPGETALWVRQLQQFLERYPASLAGCQDTLRQLFATSSSLPLRTALLQIVTMAFSPGDQIWLAGQFGQQPELRETILAIWASRPEGFPFLMEQFRADESLRPAIAKRLAQTEAGREYLSTCLPELPADSQSVLLEQLDLSLLPDGVKLLADLLADSPPALLATALGSMGPVVNGPMLELVADPAREGRLAVAGEAYWNTARQSFPIRLAKRLMIRIGQEILEPAGLKAALAQILEVMKREPVFIFGNAPVFEKMTRALLATGDTPAFLMFLEICRWIVTYCPASTANIQRSINQYQQMRGGTIREDEINLLRQIKSHFGRIQQEVEQSLEFETAFENLLVRQATSPEQLEHALASNRFSTALRIGRIGSLLAAQIGSGGEKAMWIQNLLARYPKLQHRVRQAAAVRAGEKDGSPANDFLIVLRFQQRWITASLRDQIEEILPGAALRFAETAGERPDALLCDAQYLKERPAGLPPPPKLFLLVENPADFDQYQACNPRAIPWPLSLHKTMKALLPELYFG